MITKVVFFLFILCFAGQSSLIAQLSSRDRASSRRPPGANQAPGNLLTDQELSLVKANNDFAINLYNRLSKEDENVFFSPFSIISALSMCLVGAHDQTAEEMLLGLGFDVEQEKVAGLFEAFRKRIEKIQASGKVKFDVANAIWLSEDYQVLEEYLNVVKEYFGSRVTRANFISDADSVRKEINSWIAEKTNNLIRNMLTPGMPEPDTIMMLVNAIYFKGDWKIAFKEDKTKSDDFFLPSGSSVEVEMMNQKDKFKAGKFDKYKAVELPYIGNEISMLVVLPHEEYSLSDVENVLTAQKLEKIRSEIRIHDVNLSLPRFKMEYGIKSLNESLQAIGIRQAFNASKADFSKITDRKGELYISQVLHKAFVEVNEKGTEAAAATVVSITFTSAVIDIPPPLVFRADRPFLFIIQENSTGLILFMGRLDEP